MGGLESLSVAEEGLLARMISGDESDQSGLTSLRSLLEPAPRYERFVPPEIARTLDRSAYPNFDAEVRDLRSASLAELRDRNRRLFAANIGWAKAVAMLWELNRELSRRGIAPAWRGIPQLNLSNVPAPPRRRDGTYRLSDRQKMMLMKRWVDLEWLRTVLGPMHKTRVRLHQAIFSGDDQQAIRAMERVNRVLSTGGGKTGAQANHRSLYDLGIEVSDPVRFGLLGLVDRDHGERRRNAQRRVEQSVQPRLAALKVRPSYPLADEQYQHRLIVAEALEIALGSVSLAGTVFGWMTGMTITKQSMHAMKLKIAQQCSLKTRAWRTAKS